MKKVFLLSFLSIIFFSKIIAQTPCNANFTWDTSGVAAKFLPEVTTGTTNIHHGWTFGDGSDSIGTISPYHTFPGSGYFLVTHFVYLYNTNGAVECWDSTQKVIYISQDCVVPDFTYLADASNNLKINFTNTSQYYNSTDSISWMFGDGKTSGDINVSHTYANTGVYRVCLLIKKRNTNILCIKEKCFDVVVSKPCNLQANFSWQKDPLIFNKIYFANNTVNFNTGDSITWNFGDGTVSHNLNPDHTYANAGKYTICVTIKRNDNVPGTMICTSTFCNALEIVAPDCNIVPDFTSAANATLSTRITFTNTTTGLLSTDSVRWSFGDGTYSKDVSPVHTYTYSGTYVVIMEVKRMNSAGQIVCTKNITKEIHVTEPCAFTPNFSFKSDSAIGNPFKFYFENITTTTISATDSVRWSFGDGTYSNDNGRTETHTYANAGTYSVCLIIIKRDNNNQITNCTKYTCKPIVITIPTQPCDFTAAYTSVASTSNKKLINFTATSTLPAGTNATVNWFFGDGSTTSVTGWTATHEYAQPGKYYVCVRIQTGTNCVKYKCDSVTVYDNPVPCDFTSNYTSTASTANHKLIYFTATSSLPTGTAADVNWSFGDNTSASGWTASHIYAQPGKYYVCVKIQINNTCYKYKCDSITVYDNPLPCDFTPAYTYAADATNTQKINFTNTTNTPTPNAIVKWTFGDGTDASTWNAVHTYTQPGKYYVCLRIQYGTSTSCVKYKCDSIIVVAPPITDCKQYSLYTYTPTSVNQLYAFTPVNQSNDVLYTWTFGDGMGSHDMISTHSFTQIGAYQVCLTAFKNTNCASTTCKEIRVTAPVNCDTVKVAYQYYHDQYMANKIHFYAFSNASVQQQVWTIRKQGSTTTHLTITQNNPIHDFADTGYYYVCLKVTTNGGCVKEYCSLIHIETITQLCELQTYPNPSISQVSLNIEMTNNETIHAYIYNALNVLVGEKNQAGIAGNNVVVLNTASLPAGSYTVKIIYGNHVCFAKFQKI